MSLENIKQKRDLGVPGVLRASETGQLETVPEQMPKWVDKESNLPLKDTVDVRSLVGKGTGFRKNRKTVGMTVGFSFLEVRTR